MKKYSEDRKITKVALRGLCVKKDWYTLGNIVEYSELFKLCENNITTEVIAKMATDIKEHSETEYEVTDIMYELCKISFSVFSEKEVE